MRNFRDDAVVLRALGTALTADAHRDSRTILTQVRYEATGSKSVEEDGFISVRVTHTRQMR